MNWLRRLIPWAFEHDWEVNGDPDKMTLIRGRTRNYLRCKRCGMMGHYWVHDLITLHLFFDKRGCRGAR